MTTPTPITSSSFRIIDATTGQEERDEDRKTREAREKPEPSTEDIMNHTLGIGERLYRFQHRDRLESGSNTEYDDDY